MERMSDKLFSELFEKAKKGDVVQDAALIGAVIEANRAREAEKDQELLNITLKKTGWAMSDELLKLEKENKELKGQLKQIVNDQVSHKHVINYGF